MAVVAAPDVGLTPDDVLGLADAVRFELVDGQLREHEISSLSHFIATRLASLLWIYYRSSGVAYVLTEVGYTCFPGKKNKMRRPDVSCVRTDRLAFDPSGEGFLRIRPDLAVEVISPNDLVYDLEGKLDDYRAAGIPLVWLIYPPSKRVRVIRPEGPPSELGPEDALSGQEILPGFRCPVADLFAGPASLPAKAEPGR